VKSKVVLLPAGEVGFLATGQWTDSITRQKPCCDKENGRSAAGSPEVPSVGAGQNLICKVIRSTTVLDREFLRYLSFAQLPFEFDSAQIPTLVACHYRRNCCSQNPQGITKPSTDFFAASMIRMHGGLSSCSSNSEGGL
jgi:hypothetical protein